VLDSGVTEESYEMAKDFGARARDALGFLPDIGDRQTLEELTEYILERRA
jgi:geranylgeranyl pyrophosphate synthase